MPDFILQVTIMGFYVHNKYGLAKVCRRAHHYLNVTVIMAGQTAFAWPLESQYPSPT